MGGRSDLDWSVISKEEDPVRGDCEAMDDAVSRLQGCIDVLENVCMLSSRLTDAHANFVGDAACSFDQGIRDSTDLSQSLGEICEQVRSSLHTWSAWVEQYQSEADPKCREGMQIKAAVDSLQRDLDQANADLKERQFALSHERQRQRAMTAQGIDVDAESKRRLNSLENKASDAQSHADGLQRRIDWRKDRLRELHDQVTEIEEQYQADGKRITASLEAAVGAFAGWIGKVSMYKDLGDVAVKGSAAGKLLVEARGRHSGFDLGKKIKSMTRKSTPTHKAPMKKLTVGEIAGIAGKGVQEGFKDSVAGSVVGGIADGLSTYGDRVDQYGQAEAVQDGIAHGAIATASGLGGGAIGGAVGAVVGSIVPGAGTVVGAFVGTAIGTGAGWLISSGLDALYDNQVHRGGGDDPGSHFKDNLEFWK